METKNFQVVIKSYLEQLAELDAEFAVKYFDEGKKIEECCAYIISEMEKMAQNNVVGATDDEVYGLAVRYYWEDVKVVDTKIGNHVRIVCIIRKSKFPQNPKRSVRFSGKRTKRSVQKRKARNTQKAETKVL